MFFISFNFENRLLNDDPNQQVYQFQGHRFSDNIDKDDINNNNNSAEDTFPFHTDLFEESNDVESDDFYGRTREIIIFAEKGNISWETNILRSMSIRVLLFHL